MGCILSNESEGAVVFEAGGGGRYRGIPMIPGWDWVAMSTMAVILKFEIKRDCCGDISTSIEPLINTVIGQNIAGAGYTLAAVFLPVVTQGKQRGLPMDMDSAGCKVLAKAMCIFQKDLHGPPIPQETLFLKAAMKIKVNSWNFFNPIKVDGYERLYGQLAQAGLCIYKTALLLYIYDPI